MTIQKASLRIFLMRQRKVKIFRKLAAKISELKPMAMEQLEYNQDHYDLWLLAVCSILEKQPTLPLEELLPNNRFKEVFEDARQFEKYQAERLSLSSLF